MKPSEEYSKGVPRKRPIASQHRLGMGKACKNFGGLPIKVSTALILRLISQKVMSKMLGSF